MMIHVVKSDMQESKKKRKRKSNFMGYVKLQIFKQDKAVSHNGHCMSHRTATPTEFASFQEL